VCICVSPFLAPGGEGAGLAKEWPRHGGVVSAGSFGWHASAGQEGSACRWIIGAEQSHKRDKTRKLSSISVVYLMTIGILSRVAMIRRVSNFVGLAIQSMIALSGTFKARQSCDQIKK
jgi:hypothetical protein